MNDKRSCEGSVSGSWRVSQCGKTAKHEIEGTTGGHYASEHPPRTVHLCGIHKNVLDRRGNVSVVTIRENGRYGSVQFQANDRSAYDAKIRQDRYDDARYSAYRRVNDAESAIEWIVKRKALDLAALIVDGTPLDDAVAAEMKNEIIEAREKIIATKAAYERVKSMTPDEYAQEKE